MTEIIKHGIAKFKITCPICGCEFTYERTDVERFPGQKPKVKCPDCEEWIPHKTFAETTEIVFKKSLPDTEEAKNKMFYVDYEHPTTIWDLYSSRFYASCENCQYFRQLKENPNLTPLVGDTPCTWCPKMQPYCTINSMSSTDLRFTTGANHIPPESPVYTSNTDSKE